MGNKRVLESTGKIIDLDRGEGVESLPAESLKMDSHTYGASSYPLPFSLMFNGNLVNITGGHNQFFETESGARRLILELKEMKKFPRVFPVSLHQNHSTGDVYFIAYVRINGIEHKLRITYDYRHPLVKMEVVVEYPDLDQRYMQGHWYGRNLPCYIHYWTKDWSALKVAVQMCFWLHDYYEDKNGRNPEYYVRKANNVNVTAQDVENLLRQIHEKASKFGGFYFR